MNAATSRSWRGTVPRTEPKNGDGRPRIRVTSDLHLAGDAAVGCLAADKELFQRDGALVRVVRVAEADAACEGMATGTPQIRSVTLPNLRERLSRLAVFERLNRKEELVSVAPPQPLVAAVADRGEWTGVPPVTGIIETPSMRPDGSIIAEQGYDAATGYIYAPQREYPRIATAPTLADARAALGELCEPWQDFPFRAEADRYVPIAAVLTLVCRPAIVGPCPAILFDAPARGSGKSLLTKAVTTISQGRESSPMSWPPDNAELEKVLSAYALRAASVITFDNVVGTFGGPSLDKVLTAGDRVDLRVLGKSETPSLSWRAVVLANGNNLAIGGDTSRRVLVCRIEPTCERPEELTNWRIPDLVTWCREHHPRLVAAALTVVRAYVVAGRPKVDLPGWGSFENWRDLIGAALVWAGGADVMQTRPTVAGVDDEETGSLRVIVELLPMLCPEGTMTKSLVATLYPALTRGEGRPPDTWDPLRDAIETLAPTKPGFPPTAQKLGTALGRLKGRVIGGKCLDHMAGARSGVVVWGVRKVRS